MVTPTYAGHEVAAIELRAYARGLATALRMLRATNPGSAAVAVLSDAVIAAEGRAEAAEAAAR